MDQEVEALSSHSDQMYTACVDSYPEAIRLLYHLNIVPRTEEKFPNPTPFFEIPLILFLSHVLSFPEGISERISDTADMILCDMNSGTLHSGIS